MKIISIFCGLLVVAGVAKSQSSGPATGPSGTVCESQGGSCVGIANGTKIAYDSDCGKYIVCFLDCGCDMDCPSPLHFNVKLQVCDWAENAGCDPSYSTPGDNSTDTVTPTPGGNTGGDTVTPTPGGNTGGDTVTPTPGGNTGGDTVTPTPGGNTGGDTVTPTPDGNSTNATPGGPSTGPSGTVCESPGGSCDGLADGTLIPYEGNCSAYISCFLNCGCDMPCPPGLHFNNDLKVCDWPENAGCDPSYSTPGDNSTDTVTPTPGGNTGGDTVTPTPGGNTGGDTVTPTPDGNTGGDTVTPTPDDNSTDPITPTPDDGNSTDSTPGGPATGPSGTVCESPGGSCDGLADGTLIPYEGNCSAYISCFLNCGCDMPCPPGLHFNNDLKVCDWPENAGCDPSYSTPGDNSTDTVTPTPGGNTGGDTVTPTPGGNTGGDTVTPTPGGNTGGDTVTPTPDGNSTDSTPGGPATGPSGTVCESAGGSCNGLADGTLIPYKGNCSAYIACFQNCGCDMPCPPGLHFNSKLPGCDWPEDAGCSD